MDEIKKYDPEDIESLLLNKTFEELYPEERTFVLKHMDSGSEYDSMRQTLLSVMSSKIDIDTIEPRRGSKDELLALMATEERKGFTVWLNGLLAFLFPPQQQWFMKPGLQLAVACGLILLMFTFILPGDDNAMIAEARTEELPANENANAPLENSTTSAIEAEDEIKALPESTEQDEHLTLDDEAFEVETERTEDVVLSNLVVNEDLDFVDEQPSVAKNVVVTDHVAMSDVDVDGAAEKEIDVSAKDQIVVTDKVSTIYNDTSLLFADEFHFDNHIGNQVNDVVLTESPAASRSTGQVAEIESMKIDEVLIKKRDNAEVLSAPTKKYKDLIDLLYTAL